MTYEEAVEIILKPFREWWPMLVWKIRLHTFEPEQYVISAECRGGVLSRMVVGQDFLANADNLYDIGNYIVRGLRDKLAAKHDWDTTIPTPQLKGHLDG